MEKMKFVIHESYSGKRKPEEAFASVFLSENVAPGTGLNYDAKNGIIKRTDNSQDSLCSGKGAANGTNEN